MRLSFLREGRSGLPLPSSRYLRKLKCSLKTLSTLLDCNIVTLQSLVISSERTDPIITQLIANLTSLLSIREPEPMVRRYAGICLGKIGPVDPGRLEFVVNLAETYEDIAAINKLLDVFSVGFCVELLQELVRAKSSLKEPLVAENCAFSLQEVSRNLHVLKQ